LTSLQGRRAIRRDRANVYLTLLVCRLHDGRSHGTPPSINKQVFADEAAVTTWQWTVAPQAGYLAVACDVFALNVDEMV
jgi:hypothetical protein